jgi:FkbH-like protein
MPRAALADNAYDELVVLKRSGELAKQYPLVERLLADVSDAELLAAGQLLCQLDPDEVAKFHPVPTISVAVTGHGTLGPLMPALVAQLARHGLLARATVADFNSYVFDLANPDSAIYAAHADLTLCVLDPEVVFDEVPVPWRPDDVERVFAQKLRLLDKLAATFARAGQGTLVFNTLPMRRRYAAQLVDHASRSRLGAIWREANARLLRLGETHPQLVVVDLDLALTAGVALSDPRMDAYAMAHLSLDLLAEYAREVGHLARHVAGRAKKCLALDLDNTVWGGILGDDGAEGIEVADTYRGEAFRAFQRVIKQIGSQGVLLAAVSKNDIEPVREVLRSHPSMTLREEDFVRVSADWRPKHENLTQLAEALNIGVDSFVFVDDSPYECGLVRRELPDVTVVQLDDEPAYHVERLLRDGWFDTRELTEEDRTRAAEYASELMRKDFLESSGSLTDYLRELDIQVHLAVVDPSEVPRVAQLTQRTNQFNLTGRRMQAADTLAMIEDPRAVVLAIHSKDRFSQNGLVGAIFAHWHGSRAEPSTLHLDNFVLSCRVFSRGIEQACLAAVLRHARARGAVAVYGSYRPTARNGTVKDFYARFGFTPCPAGEAADDATAMFRHDLAEIVAAPEHVHLTEDLGGDAA